MDQPQSAQSQERPKENVEFTKKSGNTKSILVMVAIAIAIALLAYGGLSIQQNLELNKMKREKEEQTALLKAEEIKRTNAELDATRKSNFQEIKSALVGYYQDKGVYPGELSDLVPEYLARVPFDPKTKKPYSYRTSVDQKKYELTTNLSNGEEYKIESG